MVRRRRDKSHANRRVAAARDGGVHLWALSSKLKASYSILRPHTLVAAGLIHYSAARDGGVHLWEVVLSLLALLIHQYLLY